MINFWHYMYFITWFRHNDISFKPVLEWWQLPHFPTKMTLIPACALYRVLIKSRTWSGPPLRIYSSLLLTYNALGYFSSPPSVRRDGRVRWIVWTLLRHKEWLQSFWGGRGLCLFFLYSIFISFFSKLLSDTARAFKYLLQGDQEVLQKACGTL